MKTFEQLRDETLAKIDQLVTEAEIVYRELVLPGWESPDRHGFPRTLYGYVMNAFCMIDLLSEYRYGYPHQTPRMRRLLVDYLKADRRLAAISVQLWRHTLMHSCDPQPIRATVSGRVMRIQWLLQWGEQHLTRDQHMIVTVGGRADEQTLNTGVLYLLNDLSEGAHLLFTELAATPESRATVVERHAEMLARQVVKV